MAGTTKVSIEIPHAKVASVSWRNLIKSSSTGDLDALAKSCSEIAKGTYLEQLATNNKNAG